VSRIDDVPNDVLVGRQKAVEDVLKEWGLPGKVVTCHHNAVRGSNDFAGIACVMNIGRPQRDVREWEDLTVALEYDNPDVIKIERLGDLTAKETSEKRIG
jgi:hypothetical protein